MSKLMKKLQALREQVEPTEVTVPSLGTVQLLPIFTSHRMKFIREAAKEGENKRDLSLLLIALSLVENNMRLCDKLAIDELIAMLDPLPVDEIKTLWVEANKLSKVTESDVEEEVKNSPAPTD